MAYNWENISTRFASKMALMLSIFVFAGYNNSVSAIPQELIKTELLLSKNYGASDPVFYLDKTSSTSKISSTFFPAYSLKDFVEAHNQKSVLTVKIRSAIFLDYRISIILYQVFTPILSSDPEGFS